MATALVSMGSNLGDRRAALDQAAAMLRQAVGVETIQVSSYHNTAPVGGPRGQGDFLNAVVRIETSLSPRSLFQELQTIETTLGRSRRVVWEPRTIDLDLLLFEREVMDEPDLVVPHRFLPFRRFVLEPACDVAEWMVHPRLCWTIEDMLRHARTMPRVFEIWGTPGDETRGLSLRIAHATGLRAAPHETGSRILGAVASSYRLSAEGTHAPERFCKAVFFLAPQDQLSASNANAVDLLAVPSMVIPADDLARAECEAVAAIEAMQ